MCEVFVMLFAAAILSSGNEQKIDTNCVEDNPSYDTTARNVLFLYFVMYIFVDMVLAQDKQTLEKQWINNQPIHSPNNSTSRFMTS